MKSGNLNFLERSGPLQACNGAALPLPRSRERKGNWKNKKMSGCWKTEWKERKKERVLAEGEET